ncbi:MAG: 50S ribosomal protein L9 [Gammaproteobacteria bacterium]|nr:50S ribosomal protein L9 [Gammaproteobacteria bacterium]
MEVILLDKIDRLGDLGSVCRVKPGYARNYLFPQKKALPATEASKKLYEGMREELEKKLLDKQELAVREAARSKDLKISFSRRASDEGKLYGSITINDIASELTTNGINIEKRQINMPDGSAIRHIGEFSVELRFDSDNLVELPIEVVPLVQE